MYLSIEDRDLWNDTSVVFGYAMLSCFGRKSERTIPRRVKSILRDFYMNDLMTGLNSVEDWVQKEVNSIPDSAKMPLRKWCSSSQAIIEQMDNWISAKVTHCLHWR